MGLHRKTVLWEALRRGMILQKVPEVNHEEQGGFYQVLYSARRVLGFPGGDGGLLYSPCDQLRPGSVHLGSYHSSIDRMKEGYP